MKPSDIEGFKSYNSSISLSSPSDLTNSKNFRNKYFRKSPSPTQFAEKSSTNGSGVDVNGFAESDVLNVVTLVGR